jgi:CRISPR/Cas system-associated exonuclease Cas4 (RecB family)
MAVNIGFEPAEEYVRLRGGVGKMRYREQMRQETRQEEMYRQQVADRQTAAQQDMANRMALADHNAQIQEKAEQNRMRRQMRMTRTEYGLRGGLADRERDFSREMMGEKQDFARAQSEVEFNRSIEKMQEQNRLRGVELTSKQKEKVNRIDEQIAEITSGNTQWDPNSEIGQRVLRELYGQKYNMESAAFKKSAEPIMVSSSIGDEEKSFEFVEVDGQLVPKNQSEWDAHQVEKKEWAATERTRISKEGDERKAARAEKQEARSTARSELSKAVTAYNAARTKIYEARFKAGEDDREITDFDMHQALRPYAMEIERLEEEIAGFNTADSIEALASGDESALRSVTEIARRDKERGNMDSEAIRAVREYALRKKAEEEGDQGFGLNWTSGVTPGVY